MNTLEEEGRKLSPSLGDQDHHLAFFQFFLLSCLMLTQKFLESSGNVVAGVEVFLSSEVVFLLSSDWEAGRTFSVYEDDDAFFFLLKNSKNESKSKITSINQLSFYFTQLSVQLLRRVVQNEKGSGCIDCKVELCKRGLIKLLHFCFHTFCLVCRLSLLLLRSLIKIQG